MEILVDWLKNSDRSKASVDQLIGKYSKEIESIESSIRDKLNVRDEEQFRDCFQKIKKSIGEMNESLDQVNDQLKNFESDTAAKIKELKDVLIQRNKQLQEAAKLTSDDGDADDAVKSKDFLDDDIEHYKQLDRDARDFSSSPSPTRSLTPVDAEEVRQVELTKQIAGEYIIKARKLISSDLFPINDVGEDVSKVIHSNSPTINQSLFSFPVCQVSQSIYDLAKLLKKMMKDARTRSDPEERYIIYQAARSVLELYLISCQTNQKKTVKYTGVFHNNCLFISHQLTMLPMEYGLWDKDKFIVTFIDLIPALKESAYDAIIDLMKQNKQLIMDFFEEPSVIEALKAASREDSSGSRSLLPFSKALKRGLTHIDQIKTSMIDCLPISVCNKLVGTLVNCLIAGMINSILGMEDIPADTASRLGEILDEITKEIDQLMESFSLPYGQILPKWLQFQEIKIILQARLKDIVDRWSDGNGPLAVAFTPEEVKSLIRSLFQNTDRRSTALARIR